MIKLINKLNHIKQSSTAQLVVWPGALSAAAEIERMTATKPDHKKAQETRTQNSSHYRSSSRQTGDASSCKFQQISAKAGTTGARSIAPRESVTKPASQPNGLAIIQPRATRGWTPLDSPTLKALHQHPSCPRGTEKTRRRRQRFSKFRCDSDRQRR
jgi:hypothetical protein